MNHGEDGEFQYFRDSAEEGSASEEESHERQASSRLLRRNYSDSRSHSTKKRQFKVLRHFAYRLVARAVIEMDDGSRGWDEQSLSDLVVLLAQELCLNEVQVVKLLDRTKTGTPAVLSYLMEHTDFSFSQQQLVATLMAQSRSWQHFVNLMGDALSMELFDLRDEDAIDELYGYMEPFLEDYRQSQLFARQLCEHSARKGQAGKILQRFTATIPAEEAAAYIHDIVMLDFFLDLPGKMWEFLSELTVELRQKVEVLLSSSHRRTADGDLIESDEDSQTGHLKGFVVETESESEADQSESDASSGGIADDIDRTVPTRRRKLRRGGRQVVTEGHTDDDEADRSGSDDETEEEAPRVRIRKARKITCTMDYESEDFSEGADQSSAALHDGYSEMLVCTSAIPTHETMPRGQHELQLRKTKLQDNG